MRIDWIDDIVALLDTGSVVEAAAMRNVSQSAFSRRIQTLEMLLDVVLIDRRSKPNRPTAALRNNQEQLRQAARQQRSLIKQIQTESRSGSRLVVVVCQHAITASLGPQIVKLISGIGKAHVRLRSANLAECEALLLTGQADFSFTYGMEPDAAGTGAEMTRDAFIADERLVPVYQAQTVEEMLSRLRTGYLDVIAYPADVFLGNAVERHIFPRIERQCQLNIVAETALTLAAMQMASAGVGVAWVPEALAQADLGDGRLSDLSAELGCLNMQIIARKRAEDTTDLHARIWAAISRGGAVVP